MGLSTALQCLLQTFFSQNALTEPNLRAVIAELVHGGEREEVTREVIAETITTLNRDLSDLDFEIRRTLEQQQQQEGGGGRHIWVLCNTHSDTLTQLATHHTQNEIAYFKALLNAIFITNNTRRAEIMAVAKMDAVREAGSAGLTKAQGEEALRQFVEESWLQLSRRGFYSLTARTLMELQGYLRETYHEEEEEEEEGDVAAMKSCHACREFLTVGYRCPNLDCRCRLHYTCFEGFFPRSKRCPVCREVEWNKQDLLHVGERAARQEVNGNGRMLDSDEEDDEERDDEIETSQ